MLKKQSHWASKKDIKKYADCKNPKNNIVLSRNAKIKFQGGTLNTNVLVVGGSGAGKTLKYVQPNIMHMNSSYVVNYKPDHCYQYEKYFFRKLDKFKDNGYKVKLFGIYDPIRSLHYNPFKYIRKRHFKEDIGLIVDAIIANTSSSFIDPFWIQMDEVLLKACIAVIFVRCKDEEKNFSSLIEMIEIERDIEGTLDPLFSELENLLNNDFSQTAIPNGEYIGIKKNEHYLAEDEIAIYKYAVKNYEKYKNTPNNTKKAIIQSCLKRLNSFLDDDILELTLFDEIELDKIGDERTVIFNIYHSYRENTVLSAMLYTQTLNTLFSKTENGEKLKCPVHFMMDGFAETGYIPQFPTFLINSTAKNRGVSISICINSILQLRQMYKDKQAEEIISSCCDTLLFLGGVEDKETLDFITERIGKEAYNELSFESPLVEFFISSKLRLMPVDKCIIMFSNEEPFISRKLGLL